MQSFAPKEGGAYATTWNLTSADHTGDALALPGAPDRALQIFGTFGGASVIVEGSNDGDNWAVLHDPTGAELILTAAGFAAILENPLRIRTRLSGGAAASVTAILVSRGSK